MKIEQCYKAGYVMKPHGLKGEVTISLDPDSPADFTTLESLFLEKGQILVPYFIQRSSVNGNRAIVKFEDIDSSDAAAYISKSTVYLPKASRPRSAADSFYDDEIIGFRVSDETLGDIGMVQEITQAGPNKLLSILHGGKEILIPVNGPFITAVRKREKLICVALPDGFLEI